MTRQPDLSHYAKHIVRSDVVTEWERNFCASIIRQTNAGRSLSAKQLEVMGRIVGKFQEAVMRDGVVIE